MREGERDNWMGAIDLTIPPKPGCQRFSGLLSTAELV